MAFDEEKLATSQAKAAREAALGDTADARGRCKTLEDKLQGLCNKLAKEVRNREEKDKDMKTREAVIRDQDVKLDERHGRLETLEQALKVERIELDGKAKVLAEDRVAFAKLEEKARAC